MVVGAPGPMLFKGQLLFIKGQELDMFYHSYLLDQKSQRHEMIYLGIQT